MRLTVLLRKQRHIKKIKQLFCDHYTPIPSCVRSIYVYIVFFSPTSEILAWVVSVTDLTLSSISDLVSATYKVIHPPASKKTPTRTTKKHQYVSRTSSPHLGSRNLDDIGSSCVNILNTFAKLRYKGRSFVCRQVAKLHKGKEKELPHPNVISHEDIEQWKENLYIKKGLSLKL